MGKGGEKKCKLAVQVLKGSFFVEAGMAAHELLLTEASDDAGAREGDQCGLDLGIQDQFFRLRTKAHEKLGVNETPEWWVFPGPGRVVADHRLAGGCSRTCSP